MKKLTTFCLLFFTIGMYSQVEYRYEIQPNGDSMTFNLLVIEEINKDESRITSFNNLDTTQIRERMYGDIHTLYDRIAQKQRDIDDLSRYRNTLFQALRSQGLDNYIEHTRSTLDSTYIATSWAYRSSDGANETLTPVFVDGGLTRLRNSDNQNVAVIVPYSRNNILLRFYPIGDLDVNMYSNDSRVYAGRDDTNVRHILVRRR